MTWQHSAATSSVLQGCVTHSRGAAQTSSLSTNGCAAGGQAGRQADDCLTCKEAAEAVVGEAGRVPGASAVLQQRPGQAPGQASADHHRYVDSKRGDEAGADVGDGEVEVPASVVSPARS